MVNSMVISWIMSVIDLRLHKSVSYVDTAQQLWDNIKKRYDVLNIPRVHKLQTEIASCKQNKDVVDFFARLIGLGSELDNSIKIPPCKCEIPAKMVKYMEEEKVHQFLMGLDNENYSTVRSQILVLDPLPSIDKIFNMVQ